jgi:hypothetical protein
MRDLRLGQNDSQRVRHQLRNWFEMFFFVLLLQVLPRSANKAGAFLNLQDQVKWQKLSVSALIAYAHFAYTIIRVLSGGDYLLS